MIIYSQCQSCGNQEKTTMGNGGSFSSSKCKKCGCENMNVQIGIATEPKWWKK